MEMKWKRK